MERGPYETCEVCGEELPDGRTFIGFHKKCASRAPKPRYVQAGFGSKGNGAHVTNFTHGEK